MSQALSAIAPAAPAAEATEDKKNSLADLLAAPAVETPAAAAKPGDDPKKIRWAKLGGPVNDEVRAAVMALGIKGVYFNQTDRRIYPQQQLAAHLGPGQTSHLSDPIFLICLTITETMHT